MPLQSSERAVLKLTDKLLSDAKKAKDALGLHERWDEYRRVYDGPGQWRSNRPSNAFANFAKNFIQRKVAALTDTKPEARVVTRRPDFGGSAKILDETTKSLWPQLGLRDLFASAALTSSITGCVGFDTDYDPDADYGQGEITVKQLPPECVYLDPGVTNAADVQLGQYVITEERVAIDDLIEAYPGRGNLVEPDKSKPKSRVVRSSRSRVVSVADGGSPSSSPDDGSVPRATLWKFHIKDLSKNARGELHYPGGRVILRSSNTVLEDRPNIHLDGLFTVDLWAWNTHYSNPWGESDVAIVRKTAEGFNRILDLMVRNMIATGNTTIIGDFDALSVEEWNKLDNLEGLIIKKRTGRDFRREAPPAYPPHYFQMLMLLPQVMETLLGLTDVAPGGKKSPGTSAGALEGFQQIQMGLLRQTARLLETTIQRIGMKLLSRIIQHYTSDRVFSIVGPKQELIQYVFQRAKLLMSDTQEVIPVVTNQQHVEFLRQFSYLVIPNSGLLMNRIQQALIAQQLLQAGIVDRKYVIDTLGPELVPDGENVLKRATQEALQRAQMGLQDGNRRIRSNRRGTQLSPGTGG